MKTKLQEILVCPRCLGKLELRDEVFEKEEIMNGRLYCPGCELDFVIEDGVAIFGIKAVDEEERRREMNGENKWVFNANEILDHIDYARKSSYAGEKVIRKLKDKTKKDQIQRKLRVLDVGAGWGCFQSWQFAKHGFEVVAAELCPEFVLASDGVAEKVFFERVVTDCTTLPFSDCSFDIVFCKELIHHVGNPMDLLNEMWRVCSPNGLIVIEEPCTTSISQIKKNIAKTDRASNVGITHYYYTYRDYLSYMSRIASELEIDGDIPIIDPSRHRILNILQKPILVIGKIPLFRNIILKMHLIFVGGSVEIIGVKKIVYKGKPGNRDVNPIDIQTSNTQQIEFYRKELIPKVLEIFSKTHEKYKDVIGNNNATK